MARAIFGVLSSASFTESAAGKDKAIFKKGDALKIDVKAQAISS